MKYRRLEFVSIVVTILSFFDITFTTTMSDMVELLYYPFFSKVFTNR